MGEARRERMGRGILRLELKSVLITKQCGPRGLNRISYTTIAGTLMVSIVQVLPSAEFFSPVYVVPCEVLKVFPNEVSEPARVMTVFL